MAKKCVRLSSSNWNPVLLPAFSLLAWSSIRSLKLLRTRTSGVQSLNDLGTIEPNEAALLKNNRANFAQQLPKPESLKRTFAFFKIRNCLGAKARADPKARRATVKGEVWTSKFRGSTMRSGTTVNFNAEIQFFGTELGSNQREDLWCWIFSKLDHLTT